MLRIGIDLGGTKTEAIALNDDGEEIARRRVPTRRDTYEDVVATVRDLVLEVESDIGESASVGAGTPGAQSPATGLMKNSNLTLLNGRELAVDLSESLAREVRIANDADCLALSEATDGAGASLPSVFAAILGTGVGGGIAVDGAIVTGPNAIAGEWGHNPLPWPTEEERNGPSCYCGLAGCIETLLSGPGLAADHERATGSLMDAVAIASAAIDGAADAVASLARYSERLARSLAAVINILDPHMIVLAGGLSQIPSLYEDVPAIWDRFVFTDQVDTQLAPAAHGDSSGVRGAAWLW